MGTIGLWGDTQVGKTAWLTTALYAGKGIEDCFDLARSAEGLGTNIEAHWRRLRQGQLLQPTANEYDLELFLRGDRSIKLRDIVGGAVNKPSLRGDLLDDVNVVLFVLEWRARDIGNHMIAIETALKLLGERPHGLIFTKCEIHLGADSRAWQGERDWWQKEDSGLDSDIIGRFGSNVWPTSAYGYCPNGAAAGSPAVLIGEYGQLIPYRIAPRNVGEPLRWALDQLGLP